MKTHIINNNTKIWNMVIALLLIIMTITVVFPALTVEGALANGNSITYTYDNAGRLTGVEYPNGASIDYTYDNAGNLQEREITDNWDALVEYDTEPVDGKIWYNEMIAALTDYVLGYLNYSHMIDVLTLYVLS